MSRAREQKLRRRMRGARGLSTALYIGGIALLGGGLLAAGIVAAAVTNATGLGIAAVIGAASLGTGGFALWESRRAGAKAGKLLTDYREQQVLRLATETSSVLTVASTAKALAVSATEAEAVLDAMVDETRVSMRVTEEGGIEYVFLELEGADARRMRVAASGDEEPIAEPEEIIAQASRET